MAKAQLSSLVHELRERIAASTSTPNTTTTTTANVTASDDDALEVRFRSVLPNLLNAFLLPYSSANDREVIAVVKLVSHTVKYFPGVFYHGSDSASLLPILARLLPFFSDPLFRSRHAIFFDALGSLLSLLRTGARDVFRHFFLDAMLAVQGNHNSNPKPSVELVLDKCFLVVVFEIRKLILLIDVVHVASLCLHHASNDGSSTFKFTLKCFCGLLSGIGDLPALLKPVDGDGLLIDLSGQARWQPFATCILKLISKCLTEGTLYVEGLIDVSFVSAACSLLCYGDADLHMACFDFVHILGTVTHYDIIPYHNLILSICIILNVDKEGLPVFRNMAYDSSMGICLNTLYSSCSEDVVKLTAADLVSVFPQSLSRTKSQELKVALCSAYARIARVCPPHIWQPEYLISALYQLEELSLPLIDCFQAALSTLDPHLVGGVQGNNKTLTTLTTKDPQIQSMRLGLKRPIQEIDNPTIKRQKVNEEIVVSDASLEMECKYSGIVTCQRVEDHAKDMNKSLLSFVQSLNAPAVGVALLSLRPEAALSALSMLCITFSIYPETDIYLRIFHQMHAWLPWIVEQAKEGNSITIDISTYLEGIHSILLSQRATFKENNLLEDKNYHEDLCVVLKLPWTHVLSAVDNRCPWKAKCLSLQVLSKLGPKFSSEVVLEVLDMGLHDEAEKVRTEAAISMPVMVFWSTLDISSPILEKIE
ncbi:hypothetical protein PIB30_004466 [Stylosanthes scabra]|uniref:Uncharacterized protein n=1 Tax=Stylosanthes scabra TaxID=79078 RepID=A0ABU6W2E8_9FABA|nr:hypothetical protein [Stylosanthes scabra]